MEAILSSILIITITCLITISPTRAIHNHGFTTNLIHRDSPLSPTYNYNPSLNKWDRVANAIHRSISRINQLMPSSLSDGIQAQVRSDKGEYLMEFSLGTPPVPQLAIADTGSDLTWVQCQPCVNCYKQKLPVFDPRKSSTYKVQSCESTPCKSLGEESSQCTKRDTCKYAYSYGDQSHTLGDLATDTIMFNPSGKDHEDHDSQFKNVVVGCGHDNDGTFKADGSGLIGLGHGPLSLVSQLGSTIGGKFSYCLIPFSNEGNLTSKISFGLVGEVSGRGVILTPLVNRTPKTFYFLTLEGVTIGTKKSILYKSSSFLNLNQVDEGNIIIDSGTTLTFLPPAFYNDLSLALDEVIRAPRADDPSSTLQLCYDSSDGGKDLNIPIVTAHFTGADLKLNPENTFIQVADDVVCLAMLPADNVAIFGNVAQGNFLVGYDTVEGTVSFKPTDCTGTNV